ncbi:MAG: hypothetical protein NT029_06260 [Armatimonadetes bacterium]|nr:hypothetical protein [Armatimonadota bacterium]
MTEYIENRPVDPPEPPADLAGMRFGESPINNVMQQVPEAPAHPADSGDGGGSKELGLKDVSGESLCQAVRDQYLAEVQNLEGRLGT